MVMPAQRPHQSVQDVQTPPEFMRAVVARFGPIWCDLAATKSNAQSKYFYSPERNSLAQSWSHEFSEGTLWLNPPFSDIGPWAEKCVLESKKRHGLILLLTPASYGAEWFAKHVEGHAYVFALRPRLKFVGHMHPYPKDLSLSVFGFGMRGFDSWRWDKT